MTPEDDFDGRYYVLRNNDDLAICAGDLIQDEASDSPEPRDWVTVIQKNAMDRPERRRWIRALQSVNKDDSMIRAQYVEDARRAKYGR